MLKLLFIMFSVLCTMHVQGQEADSCMIKMDSLFQAHFLSLDTMIQNDSTRQFVPQSDTQFIYLVGFLSGVNFQIHSYSGHPMLNYKDVITFKTWYNLYRRKIDCKSVDKGLLLLQKEMTEDTIDELEKLKVD